MGEWDFGHISESKLLAEAPRSSEQRGFGGRAEEQVFTAGEGKEGVISTSLPSSTDQILWLTLA